MFPMQELSTTLKLEHLFTLVLPSQLRLLPPQGFRPEGKIARLPLLVARAYVSVISDILCSNYFKSSYGPKDTR